MSELNKFVEILERNYWDLKPRFNDFAIEIVREIPDKDGQEEHIWFYMETILQKLTPSKEAKIKELLGCVDLLLLEGEYGYYARRKLAIQFK